MKGLLLKDWYMLIKYYRNFLFVIVGMSILYLFSRHNPFFLVYPMIVAVMIPISLMSYDEKTRWSTYCDALPCTRAQVVSAKYVFCILGTMAVLLFSALIISVSSGMDELIMLYIIGSIGLLVPGITLPVIFKLGVEKGRLAYYLGIAIICGAGIAAGTIEIHLPEQLLIFMPLAAIVIFALSWLLSIRLYSKRCL